MNKKVLSLLLAILLLTTTVFSNVAAAQNLPIMRVETVGSYAGETVNVNVVLEDNPGFSTASVKIDYDSKRVELLNAKLGDEFASGANVSYDNLPYLTFVKSSDTTDSNFLTLTFKVLDNASAGDAYITIIYDEGDISNKSEEDVNFQVVDGKITVTVKPVAITGISLNKATLSLKTGESDTLIATISPENATNKTVKWESSDTSVATVDSNGKVNALRKGTATITVTTEDGSFTDTCAVSVACSHIKTTVHSAKASTCQAQGNNEYITCDDCGAVISGTDAKLPLAAHNYIEKAESQYLKSAATCVSKAVYYKSCSVCGVKSTETFEYGEVDPENHKHTEIRNTEVATCCESGYTGDTWCTDCNKKIETGKAIPATGNHVDVDGKWESDGTSHWHTCYFGTKFDITSHSGGEATCKDKAICSVCKTAYGELNASNHKGNTYLKDQKEATCYKEGYTGDTYCSDCNVKIKDGTVIAKSAHNPASVWTTDETNHWKVCQTIGCGNIIDKAPHSGGEATCTKKAVCSICGVEYGEVNASNHKRTEVRDAKEASCSEAGYTGDTWCLDCNKMISEGKDIEMLEHKLALVKSEEATAAKEGNIEYYYCENCSKYYSDEAGTKEIAKEDTVVAKLAPKIIDGNNAKIDKSSKEPVSFHSDAAFTDFIRVELDGKELVKDKDYTLKEGSIIVTLTPEFTATLTAGEHTLGIVSTSGTAVASFTVTADSASDTVSDNSPVNDFEKSPQTGDTSNVLIWLSILSLACLAVVGITVYKKALNKR